MRSPWICVVIVATLGLTTLLGTAGLVALSLYRADIPQALVAVVTGALGALSSFLVSPPKGSVGMPEGKPAE